MLSRSRLLFVFVLLAPAAGLIRMAGHAPDPFWPSFFLTWLAFGMVVWLSHQRWSLSLALLLAGLIAHGAGVAWVGEAFLVDAERFGHLRHASVVVLGLVLALTDLIAFLLVWRRGGSFLASLARAILALSLGELLRRVILGGFPWNLQAYALADTGFDQWVYLVGSHGLPLLLGPFLLAFVWAVSRRYYQLSLLPLFLLAGFALWGNQRDAPAEREETIRIVQPSIPQDLKWVRALRDAHVARILGLADQPGKFDILVFPENALPLDIMRNPQLRRDIMEVGDGGHDFLGGQLIFLDPEQTQVRNALITLDGQGEVVGSYSKRRLVPFGEALPFRRFLEPLGLDKLFPMKVDFEVGSKRHGLVLPQSNLSAQPLICFEAAFPEGRAGDDDFLVNVTNDAWFGTSNGPHQHLMAARFRAMETGLPVLRAANTGISAIIDARGGIVSSLGLQLEGLVEDKLPGRYAPSLFAKFGEWVLVPIVAAWLVMLGLVPWIRGQKNK